MADLREYRRKRDPGRTPEPFAGDGGGSGDPIFVVQRHDARRLHYDFRLERGGALASWAVPKGIPLEPGEKALAVHVEDHPLEYATFAGTIPKGHYGAGTVEIWDHGTYRLVEEKRDGGLTVELAGERLRGRWTLVPARLDGQERNWLILKKRDAEAPAAPAGAPVDWHALVPMLATASDDLPPGAGWTYEVKWDGYRTIAVVEGGEVRLHSRRGNDLTERFRPVTRALPRALRSFTCVLDGEVCALDEHGRPSFSAMQQGAEPLVYYLFDLVMLEGASLLERPLRERQAELARLLVAGDATVRLSKPFADGEGLLAAAEEQSLEGVVAKRLDAPYRPGRRTGEWLKVKTSKGDEFVIVGYTRGKGRREARFGSLVLATVEGGGLRWVGNVGTGFSDAEIDRLLAKLRPLEQAEAPLAEVPKMPRVRRGDIVWVAPRLVCEVEFAEWTHGRQLRAPRYKGLRDDRTAADVHRERPRRTEVRRGRDAVQFTNVEKVFWPDEAITKGDLLEYYLDVAPTLLPHIRDRPFTMKRYPDGIRGEHFFQKNLPDHAPAFVPSVELPSSGRRSGKGPGTIRFALVNDELVLAWVVNSGCIDLNVEYSRADRPDRPDFVLFDLDPAAGSGFREAVQVALLVREALEALGLRGYPKTSGSDGLHVLVPVERRYTFAETRAVSEVVARALARAHPRLVTTEWSKAKRRGVLVDANQNGSGKTIASVYSVRPDPGAPVSTPLRWDEVTPDLDPRDFTMDVVLGRIAGDGDLYAPVLGDQQSLDALLSRMG